MPEPVATVSVTYPPGALSAAVAIAFERACTDALRAGLAHGLAGALAEPDPLRFEIPLAAAVSLDASQLADLRAAVGELFTIGSRQGLALREEPTA